MDAYDILVVDDDPEAASLYEAFMTVMPYSFRVVNSAEKAIELLKSTKFTVFILDIDLGYKAMTGVDLSIKIKEVQKDAKVYALTGHTTLFDGFDPPIAGFDDVFNKPFGYKDLIALLKDILGDRINK
jgi:DNA-binding NtrC family response regulator